MSEPVAESGIVLELAEEFVERYRRGERPSLNEYAARYPQFADEIREVFPAMAMMENVAPVHDSVEDASLAAAPADVLHGFEQLGDFRIIREVGRGGMGVVYEAEQLSLGRGVAIKVLPPTVSRRRRHRFEREARAAARLHHTNIVPVFGVGEFRGMHYYVMQFIQGLGLNDVLNELRRMQAAGGTETGTPAASDLHAVPRPGVSVQEIARTLLSGEYDGYQATDIPIACREQFPARASDPAGRAPPDGYTELPAAGTIGQPTVDYRTPNGLGKPADVRPVRIELQPTLSAAPPTPASGPAPASNGRPAAPPACAADTFAMSGSTVLSARSGDIASGSRRGARSRTYWHSVAHVGRQVADALEYAHDQGILHRDIKPGNLLLDTRGTVWITDFGLAKAEDHRDLTQTGDVLGTLRYMPPEAFEGRSDPRGDIYSLGLTLYELAALRPAFDITDRHQLMRELMCGDPTRLEKLKPDIPRDLATIIHKAIERDPLRRYQTARELADDLSRFLEDEPILARPLRVPERVGRWCRHKPALALLTTAVALLLVSVAVVSTVSAFRISRARDDESIQRRLAEATAEESRLRLVDAHVASGMRLVEQGDPHGGLPSLARALELDQADPARAQNHRLRLAAALDGSAKLVALWAAADRTERVEFCPDGLHVVAGGSGGLEIREVTSGQSVRVIARGTPLKDFRFSPDGRRVATAAHNGTARLWNLATGEPVGDVLQHGAVVHSIRFDSEGRRLVTASDDRTARIWDAATGAPLRSFSHPGTVQSAVFSPDDLRLLTASTGTLRVWNIEDGQQVFPTIDVDIARRALEIAFSGDGSRIIAAGGERIVRTWDALTGRPLLQIGGGGRAQLSVDGNRTVSYSSAAQVWDVVTGAAVTPPLSEVRSATVAAFSPLGDRLLTAGWDGRMRVWDLASVASIGGPLHHGAAVVSAAFSLDGRLVVTLDRAGLVRVWDLAGTAHDSRLLETQWVSFVAVSPDGRWVVNDHGSMQGCAWLWDASSGRLVATLRDGARTTGETVGGTLIAAAFSPGDSSRLVTVFDHGTARIWDSATGAPLSEPLRHSGLGPQTLFHADGSPKVTALISHAEFSPDGRELVTAGADKVVRVWDASTGRLLREMQHDHPVLRATYSPDGRRLLTVTADAVTRWGSFESAAFPVPVIAVAAVPTGTAQTRVWDASTHRALTPPIRHRGTVLRAAFSPDGRSFLTVSTVEPAASPELGRAQRMQVEVWETASGRPLGPPLRHHHEVVQAALSPDGRMLATGGFEGAIRIWDVATGKPLRTLAGHAGLLMQVVFSSSGRQLLSASLDGLARVWEPDTGQLVAVFQHELPIYLAAFDRDGESVVTACADSSMHRWPFAAGQRSPGDSALLAATLAPGPGESGSDAETQADPAGAWQTIRTKHPREFMVPVPEQFAWHRQSLADALASQAWPAALAQLDSLLALDPGNWRDRLDRARLLTGLERWDEAEAEFTRATERHPVNPAVWVARASFLLGRGRRDEAAADLARTIEMDRDSSLDAALSDFWVAGPYAEDLRMAQPPESQVDPTQPIPRSWDVKGSAAPTGREQPGPGSRAEPGSPTAPSRWQAAAAGPSGMLDFGTYFGQAEHLSAYALAYVYARADQDVTIWSGSDDDLRLWLNDELIHEHPWSRPPFPDKDRVPAKLNQGWNTVLAKVVNRGGRHGLFLRLSADPADLAAALADRRRWDESLVQYALAIEQHRGGPGEAALRSERGLLHARLGHWREAHADYTRGVELEPDNHVPWYHRAPLRLKLGDRDGYVRECREMLARFRTTTTPIVAERTVKNCIVLPDTAGEPDVLLALAERAVTGTEHTNLHPYFQSIRGIAAYRAHRFDESVPWLQKADNGLQNPPCKAMTQLFIAMADHQLGRHDKARTVFAEATAYIDQHMPKQDGGDLGLAWHDWIRCQFVLEEAEALIRARTGSSR